MASKIKDGMIFKNKSGEDFVILKYSSKNNIKIQFLEPNKYETVTRSYSVNQGSIKNPFNPTVYGVGYMGQGRYSLKIEGVGREAYDVWTGMLRRCYCPKAHQNKYKSYKDCSVNTIWHNFQNFADWFYNHPLRKAGWHLDKDLMVQGNREYGPLRCTFIPPELNSVTVVNKARRGELPIGVVKVDTNRYVASLKKYGERSANIVARSSNIMECFLGYKKAKEEYMSELALAWDGILDPRVIHSLRNWSVGVED